MSQAPPLVLQRVIGLSKTESASLAFSSGATPLVAYPAGCSVVCYDPKGNQQSLFFFNPSGHSVAAVAFSPDGRFLAAGEEHETGILAVCVWCASAH